MVTVGGEEKGGRGMEGEESIGANSCLFLCGLQIPTPVNHIICSINIDSCHGNNAGTVHIDLIQPYIQFTRPSIQPGF
jgi:hypothetical protein